MALDLSGLNRAMPWILKTAIQQQLEQRRQRGWLENTLAEQANWGQLQERLSNMGLRKESLLTLLKLMAQSQEKQDRPGLKLIDMLRDVGISSQTYPEMGLPTPTKTYEEAINPYQEATKMVMESYKDLSYPEAQAVAKMVLSKGSDFATDLIKDIAKKKGEEKARGLRKETLEEQEKARQLREEELGVKREKLKIEKTGKSTKKEDVKELKSFIEDRWNAIEKLRGEEAEDAPNKGKIGSLKSKIQSLTSKIKSLKKSTGADPEERHARAAAKIKERGYTKKDLFENEQLKAWMAQKNLSPWILAEYF